MIRFTPAKINLGLLITEKRPDGFHNLQSLMLPIGLCDIMEVNALKSASQGMNFSMSGRKVDSRPGENLCERAYELMSRECELPPVALHLHKQIPVGAGLGGGSSNASHTLLALNQLTPTPLSKTRLHELAAELGSDCPFFLHGKAMMMEGRGEVLSPCPMALPEGTLALLFPHIHCSTAEAYGGISPRMPELPLEEVLKRGMGTWRNHLFNDFEEGIFRAHPEIERIKLGLYDSGALYASMSGSGSAVFGIFAEDVQLPKDLNKYLIWKGPLGAGS